MMKDLYLTFDAVQLATDEDFIRWAQGDAAQDDIAWQTWLDRHPEKRALVEEAGRLVKSLQFQPAVPAVDKDKLWSRIQASAHEPAQVKPLVRRRALLVRIAGVAAAIAILLFVVFGIDRPHRLQTALMEQENLLLPDQSTVRLNADSRLSYDDSGRKIALDGEAFFAVQKGTDFVVNTPLGQVQVLGTKFNVFSRSGRFEVQCTEGRVKVTTSADPEGVILTPGMAAVANPSGDLSLLNLSGLEAEVDWLQDIYRFKDQPMRQVFEELERQYGVQITADEEIRSRPHTGFFVGGQLAKALEDVCWPQKLKFSIEGKQVLITDEDTE